MVVDCDDRRMADLSRLNCGRDGGRVPPTDAGDESEDGPGLSFSWRDGRPGPVPAVQGAGIVTGGAVSQGGAK